VFVRHWHLAEKAGRGLSERWNKGTIEQQLRQQRGTVSIQEPTSEDDRGISIATATTCWAIGRK